jgi:hypothetical protein
MGREKTLPEERSQAEGLTRAEHVERLFLAVLGQLEKLHLAREHQKEPPHVLTLRGHPHPRRIGPGHRPAGQPLQKPQGIP